MARLLVSCCNTDGGLMTAETETGAAERLLDGNLRGIAVTPGRVMVETILCWLAGHGYL